MMSERVMKMRMVLLIIKSFLRKRRALRSIKSGRLKTMVWLS